jgi:hypothetical protein
MTITQRARRAGIAAVTAVVIAGGGVATGAALAGSAASGSTPTAGSGSRGVASAIQSKEH